MKQVCQLSSEGFFIALTEAQESPREPGVWLIPAGAVDCPPPPNEPGFKYRREAEEWVAVPIVEAAEAPEEQSQQPSLAMQLRWQLAQLDADSIRPLREIAAASQQGIAPPEEAVAKLARLEGEAEPLREQLRSQPNP